MPSEYKPRFEVKCPACHGVFTLRYNEPGVIDTVDLVVVENDPGVYGIKIVCPQCQYEQEIW